MGAGDGGGGVGLGLRVWALSTTLGSRLGISLSSFGNLLGVSFRG